MGLATAQVLRRATPAHGRLISLAGAAAFLAAGAAEDLALLPHEAWVSRLTYGAASCTIILAAISVLASTAVPRECVVIPELYNALPLCESIKL